MPQFQVTDMTCKHCEATISRAIKELDAQATITIDLSKHLVSVESAQAIGALETAIREAGFSPQAI
jgi:copper chaperone